MKSSTQYKNNTSLRFQLVLDSANVIIGTSPAGQLRLNVTGLDIIQLEKIVDGIADSGPETVEHFVQLVKDRLEKPEPKIINA